MSRLKKLYESKIKSELKKELGLKNVFQVPHFEKVIVNVGIGTYVARVNSDYSFVEESLTKMCGQKPVLRKARIAVSNFNKLRIGQPNGLVVTLRGERMYDFLDKLVNITLPRTRDFQGVSLTSFDRNGNYTIGITDHTIFPEVVVNDIVKPHGLQITIVTSAKTDKNAKLLLDKIGFPFKKKKTK